MVRHAADGTVLRSWQIGNVNVTRIDEYRITNPLEHMFSNAMPGLVANNPWLKPHFVDGEGQLWLYFNSFVAAGAAGRIVLKIVSQSCIG